MIPLVVTPGASFALVTQRTLGGQRLDVGWGQRLEDQQGAVTVAAPLPAAMEAPFLPQFVNPVLLGGTFIGMSVVWLTAVVLGANAARRH